MENNVDVCISKYNLYEDIKFINKVLKDCVANFVLIGFRLQEIKNNKTYQLLDYSSFEDFSLNEFNLNSTSIKNYIAVANKFGDKETKRLKSEYDKYSLTQLVELLPVSNNIDDYSPEMSVKEIRSIKLISQLTDYKKEFLLQAKNYLENYIKENQKILPFKLKLKIQKEYFTLENSFKTYNYVYVYLENGYYSINHNRFYEINIEKFLCNLKSKIEEYINDLKKDYERKEKDKLKEKERMIASLPENEKGISSEEKSRRIKERVDNEKIDVLMKKIKKNKDIEFIKEIPYYLKNDLLCLYLFCTLNKQKLYNYKLIYTYNTSIPYKKRFIGLINGLYHFRIFDRHIEQYDHKTNSFVEIFSLDSTIKKLVFDFEATFGRLFNGHEYSYSLKTYYDDVNRVFENLNSKEFELPGEKDEELEIIEEENEKFNFDNLEELE